MCNCNNCRHSVCYCSEYVDVPMNVYQGQGACCGGDGIVSALEDIAESIRNTALCCCARCRCGCRRRFCGCSC